MPTQPALQSLTGKYRGLQGNPCNVNRNPAMRTGVPCNENSVFSVGIDLQGLGLQCGAAAYVCEIVVKPKNKQSNKQIDPVKKIPDR